MHPRRAVIALLLVTSVVAAVPHVALAVAVPPPPPVQSDEVDLDDATRRVLELERMVIDLRGEQTAIETRATVMGERIQEQSEDLEIIKARLREAQDIFNERAVAMYKFTGFDGLELLLDSNSFTDFMGRVTVLTRVLDVDRGSLEEAAVVASQADFESGALEELRAQDAELRKTKEQSIAQVQTALSEQQLLVAKLDTASKKLLEDSRAADAKTRKQWQDASVPLDAKIRKVNGVVLPYTDRKYLVSEYHPRTYKTTGVTYNAVCSWYGPGFHGRPTASGQTYNQNDFTCASRNLPFGTWLALTRGSKRIVVVVNDRGPYVAGRDLDLSAAAARALGFWGVETVGVEVVKPTTNAK